MVSDARFSGGFQVGYHYGEYECRLAGTWLLSFRLAQKVVLRDLTRGRVSNLVNKKRPPCVLQGGAVCFPVTAPSPLPRRSVVRDSGGRPGSVSDSLTLQLRDSAGLCQFPNITGFAVTTRAIRGYGYLGRNSY